MYSLDWARVYGMPQSTAVFKATADDFHVNEFFSDSFSGQGEHILLKIEKKNLTTEELVKSLAVLINKPTKLISYAGLKDRQALTTQWISVHAPGEEIAGIESLSGPGWRVLEATRHHKKIRPGFLTGNRFMVRLHEVTDSEDLLRRVELIKQSGVPNYFGEQRFGREGGNLVKAEALLVQKRKIKDRFLRGMYCSAARSWIFNSIVAKRVQEGTWNTALAGDVMQLSGSNSIFFVDEVNAEIVQRIRDKDISPASPLAGKGKNKVTLQAQEVVNEVYTHWASWVAGLEALGLDQAWRANVLHPEQLECVVHPHNVELYFTLPAGSYATAILRELVRY